MMWPDIPISPWNKVNFGLPGMLSSRYDGLQNTLIIPDAYILISINKIIHNTTPLGEEADGEVHIIRDSQELIAGFSYTYF